MKSVSTAHISLLLLVLKTSLGQYSLQAASADESWLIKTIKATDMRGSTEAKQACTSQFQKTGYYSKLKSSRTSGLTERALLENLCGTYQSPEEYTKLFGSLSGSDKINPMQSAVIAAARRPEQGCFTAGTFGRGLRTLNATNKRILCLACGKEQFAKQGDWQALKATCGESSANKIINTLCTALKQQEKSGKLPFSWEKDLLKKCPLSTK